jgi:hypothetical protein
MFRQDSAGKWVDLAERHGLHSGAFEAEIETAYSSE